MIRTVAETGSTNDDLAALARAGAEEGLWLRADRQQGGRGRQGRVWHSPAGNLYASTIVRLRAGDPPAPTLALVAAFARWLGRWRSEGLAPVRARWLAAAHPPGTALSASTGDGGRIDGLFEGLDETGALRLRLADGSHHVIHAGDVFLIGEN